MRSAQGIYHLLLWRTGADVRVQTEPEWASFLGGLSTENMWPSSYGARLTEPSGEFASAAVASNEEWRGSLTACRMEGGADAEQGGKGGI